MTLYAVQHKILNTHTQETVMNTLLKNIRKFLKQPRKTQLELYINSKNPQSIVEIERLTLEYIVSQNRGFNW